MTYNTVLVILLILSPNWSIFYFKNTVFPNMLSYLLQNI